MNPGRAPKLNRPIVAQHFQEVKDLYEELDILQTDTDRRLYNMDEKGCRLTFHHQQTVLAQKVKTTSSLKLNCLRLINK